MFYQEVINVAIYKLIYYVVSYRKLVMLFNLNVGS